MEQILVVPDFALVLYLGQTKRAVLFFEREASFTAAAFLAGLYLNRR